MNTVQDLGRRGYQVYGVPVSGAMDPFAFRAANELVANPSGEAALEIRTHVALETEAAQLVAVTGAEASVEVDGRSLPLWCSLFLRRGARIEIELKAGGWSYLAVHGGIDVPQVLGSKSTYLRGGFGGLHGRALENGDELPIGAQNLVDLVALAGRQADKDALAWAALRPPARVIPGPHQDHFSEEAMSMLLTTTFIVTERSDRMGYRLRGNRIEPRQERELLSCGVPPGAIQVPPDGQPIVLMADHQTTGGYPILATVVSADLPLVAQCGIGQSVTFRI